MMRVLLAMVAALGALGAEPAMADLYPAAQTVNVTEGATDTAIAFDAVTPSYDKPLFPDVQFDSTRLALVGPISSSAPNSYHAAFKTVATLPGGVTTGTITFRMCRDSPCAHPWPGTEQVFTYTVNVALKDWVTYQRDAAHSGYVHAGYTGIFKKRWVWQPAGAYRFTRVATKGSTILVASEDNRGPTSIVALTMLGAPIWVSPIGVPPWFGEPAVSGNTVYFPSIPTSSNDNPITALDVATGAPVTPAITFDSQYSPLTAPTPFGDSLYVAAGYNGNEVISYDLAAGTRRWTSYGQGGWIYGGETPAVDDGHVYYYSGGYLDIFDRATGQRTTSIRDPNYDFASHSGSSDHYYLGAPMLGTGGNVILPDDAAGQVPLVKFTPAGDATQLGSGTYQGPPAFAHGVVYAAGTYNGAARLDAVSEADGALLWTWSPPADDLTPPSYIGNVIATDTLIFMSTQTKLYAISATDPAHPVVWSAATPGAIAISRDNLLLVTTTLNGNPALVAYSVK
jgi:hypothetical protein